MRLAEERKASTTEVVDRLFNSVGTFEARLEEVADGMGTQPRNTPGADETIEGDNTKTFDKDECGAGVGGGGGGDEGACVAEDADSIRPQNGQRPSSPRFAQKQQSRTRQAKVREVLV